MIDVRLAGRYRLEAEAGAGGMTSVWQAVDEVLERPVAVKILQRHLLSNQMLCERFRREALAAGALTHPNIAAVYDTGLYDDAPYVVTEYLGGGSLAQALRSQGALPPARVAAIGAEACEALAYAHQAGVVHRNLKPSNILFSDAGPLLGRVKVTDFAVGAAALGGDLTATGALLGTLSFLAPEVLEGADPTPASDLYALGVVLFKALTGRSPRGSGGELSSPGKPRTHSGHPRDLTPAVPRDLDAIVARVLSEDPENRLADAAELGRLLRGVAQSRSVHSPLPPPPAAAPAAAPAGREAASFVRTEGRWLAPVILLVLTAVAVVIGVLQLSGHLKVLTGGGGNAPPVVPNSTTVALKPGGTYKPNPPPGDPGEHSELVADAFDGNPSTAWHTETYVSPTFGGLRPGVGIYGDLGQPMSLSKIEVDSPTPGWQGGIAYSNDAKSWTLPAATVTAGATQDFAVSADGPHRYWMVWITSLPAVPGQPGSYQAEISEIKAFH
jgi:tRNA A-37 threonylcarbamoyl transferase component Bud32